MRHGNADDREGRAGTERNVAHVGRVALVRFRIMGGRKEMQGSVAKRVGAYYGVVLQ